MFDVPDGGASTRRSHGQTLAVCSYLHVFREMMKGEISECKIYFHFSLLLEEG